MNTPENANGQHSGIWSHFQMGIRFWIWNAALAALAFGMGWWAHSGVRVQAQTSGDVFFQIKGLSSDSALMLYYPDQNAIYVYQSVLTGLSFLPCAYKFQLGKPGAPITRHICPIVDYRP